MKSCMPLQPANPNGLNCSTLHQAQSILRIGSSATEIQLQNIQLLQFHLTSTQKIIASLQKIPLSFELYIKPLHRRLSKALHFPHSFLIIAAMRLFCLIREARGWIAFVMTLNGEEPAGNPWKGLNSVKTQMIQRTGHPQVILPKAHREYKTM